jgi:hypothetical protein
VFFVFDSTKNAGACSFVFVSFNPKFAKIKSLPEGERSEGSLFLKEVGEVSYFFEAKTVCNF